MNETAQARAKALPQTTPSQSVVESRPFSPETSGHEHAPPNLTAHDFGSLAVHTSPAPIIQPKLKLGPVDDPYERKADRVAQQVVKGMSPTPGDRQVDAFPAGHSSPNGTPLATPVGAGIAGAIQQARDSGQPLPPESRAPMERALGADFSQVRIHRDAQADSLAGRLFARAFTVGRHIFFGRGEFSRAVLAHELTHTLQQGATGGRKNLGSYGTSAEVIQRKPPNLKEIENKLSKMGKKEKEVDKSNTFTDFVKESLNKTKSPEEAKIFIEDLMSLGVVLDVTGTLKYAKSRIAIAWGKSKWRNKKFPIDVQTDPESSSSSTPNIFQENLDKTIAKYSRKIAGGKKVESLKQKVSKAEQETGAKTWLQRGWGKIHEIIKQKESIRYGKQEDVDEDPGPIQFAEASAEPVEDVEGLISGVHNIRGREFVERSVGTGLRTGAVKTTVTAAEAGFDLLTAGSYGIGNKVLKGTGRVLKGVSGAVLYSAVKDLYEEVEVIESDMIASREWTGTYSSEEGPLRIHDPEKRAKLIKAAEILKKMGIFGSLSETALEEGVGQGGVAEGFANPADVAGESATTAMESRRQVRLTGHTAANLEALVRTRERVKGWFWVSQKDKAAVEAAIREGLSSLYPVDRLVARHLAEFIGSGRVSETEEPVAGPSNSG